MTRLGDLNLFEISFLNSEFLCHHVKKNEFRRKKTHFLKKIDGWVPCHQMAEMASMMTPHLPRLAIGFVDVIVIQLHGSEVLVNDFSR